jgi:O-methyltransferase involved in polyketide biosynthesis
MATQQWKKRRLAELRLPATQRFVPVDFEKGQSWLDQLSASGFDQGSAATLVSTGVSMYLSAEANEANLREIARFAPGTTFAMTFLLPLSLLPAQERPMHEKVFERARAAGTPFRSFYRPAELLELAKTAGFQEARHVARDELVDLYFRGRTDGLIPAEGEEFLVVTTGKA